MYKAIAANKRNTVFIMAVFVGIITGLGWLVAYFAGDGNPSIFMAVFIGAFLYALLQYFSANKLVALSVGAEPIDKKDAPELYRIVENLAITDGLPMPKVYIINDPAPNAFASGRDPQHSIIGVTQGLLEIMDKKELEGVLAHEMSHIKNYDIRVSTISFALVAVIGLISDLVTRIAFYSGDDNKKNPVILVVGLVAAILAPFAAGLIQLSISRQREYLADASGAMITRYPDGLISALKKLQEYGRPMQRQSQSSSHLFFSNPLRSGFLSNLFSTHPPLEQRIERLSKNSDKF